MLDPIAQSSKRFIAANQGQRSVVVSEQSRSKISKAVKEQTWTWDLTVSASSYWLGSTAVMAHARVQCKAQALKQCQACYPHCQHCGCEFELSRLSSVISSSLLSLSRLTFSVHIPRFYNEIIERNVNSRELSFLFGKHVKDWSLTVLIVCFLL